MKISVIVEAGKIPFDAVVRKVGLNTKRYKLVKHINVSGNLIESDEENAGFLMPEKEPTNVFYTINKNTLMIWDVDHEVLHRHLESKLQ